MPEIENAQPTEIAAGVEAPNIEAGSQTAAPGPIAGTLPPLEPGKSEKPKKPGIISMFKRKRGRPKKNPFAAPTVATASSETVGPAANSPLALEIGGSPQVEPADFTAYGEAGAAVVCGIYSMRTESMRGECEKKLPLAVVDRCLARFSVPDNIKSGLESAYSDLAEEFNLPPSGGKWAKLVAHHTNLELHYREMVRAVLTEIRKLPDLNSQQAAS